MPKPIRKLADLTPDPHNARTHSAANLDLIDASLDAVGAGRSIVISKTGRILAGNATVSRALAKGLKVKVVDGARDTIIAVRRSDLSEQDETTLALYDNRAAELAAWNPEVLQSLQRDGHDLGAMWPAEDLAKLLAEDAAPSTRDVDEVPPVRASTRIKAGDLFALGGSRLLCADCRADGAIAHALRADTRAQVVFTSPPYASQRKYDTSSGFTPIHPDDYVDWFNDVQRACWAALADDGSYFLNIKEHTDAGQRHLYVKDLTIAHVRRWGWRWVDEFCWRDTKNGVPGIWPNRFKDAWEPVFHFTKQAKIKFRPLANAKASDAAFSYQPSIKASSTGSGLLGAGGRPISASGLARPSNVIEIAASSTGGHSAAFPVALPRWFIDAFTDAGDWVLEPFSGSGTTLVAATQADRRCAAVEISAAYVQVAIDRWELLTGQKAERLERGR
jgi:site-specific DNA-methyltransferase (adenine-specific)